MRDRQPTGRSGKPMPDAASRAWRRFTAAMDNGYHPNDPIVDAPGFLGLPGDGLDFADA